MDDGLTLWDKVIDLNHFKADIISDAFEESCIDFEDTIYGEGDLSNTKEFSHEKWTQWEYSIYNYSTPRKKS